MTELTDAQLRSILGGAPEGPDPASLPWHRRPAAAIKGLPQDFVAMHEAARKAFESMTPESMTG